MDLNRQSESEFIAGSDPISYKLGAQKIREISLKSFNVYFEEKRIKTFNGNIQNSENKFHIKVCMQACVFVAFFFFSERATKETVESIQFC